MAASKGTIIELTVESAAYGGQGVARLDGFVVFVNGAVPGDRVRAQILKKRKAYAEAKIIELLEPSPDRVQAPCPYAGYCGGCQWQHVRYERQLAYKWGHVRDAMVRIGTLPEFPIREVIPSDKAFGYRNKMEFSFSRRRWLLPEEMGRGDSDPGFALGLHVPGTFDKVLDLEACLLQHETGNQILRSVKRFVEEGGIPVYGMKSHQGFWRFLALRHSTHFDEWMVNVITSEERRDVVRALATALAQEFGCIGTVVNNISAKRAAIAVGEREIVLSGEGIIEDKIGPFTFQISANSFFQTNAFSAERLFKKVAEYAELEGSEVVLDLYSGTGTIPVFLAGHTRGLIIGMEIMESAVLDARRNCRVNGISNCQFLPGDIREILPALKEKPEVLIIDPPRAGMHKDVLARVMQLGTERVVYVSCNPATLARDLGLMAQDYEVVEIQPVDMFPHTYHVETVAKLARRR